MIFLFEPTRCGIIFKFNTQLYIYKRENWGHTRMYDPKNPLVSLLTENICSYFCNYLAPSVFHCGNNVERGKPLLPIYRMNTDQHHNLLQIYKDARSFSEIPLRYRIRIFQFGICLKCRLYDSTSNEFSRVTTLLVGVAHFKRQKIV